MTLDDISEFAIEPALAWLPPKMTSPEARVMLLATGLQESKFVHRYQVLNDPTLKGPARGFWQFERGGGVIGVMTHPAVRDLTREACRIHGVPFEARAIWQTLETNDILAAICARLLYWTAPGALPRVTDTVRAWNLYIDTWRPGKPHIATWAGHHRAARAFLQLP